MLWSKVKLNQKKRWLLSLREKLNILGTMLISDEVMADPKMSAAIKTTIRHTQKRIADKKGHNYLRGEIKRRY